MFDNVRIEFINMVENKNWMDSTSRKGTVDKVYIIHDGNI